MITSNDLVDICKLIGVDVSKINVLFYVLENTDPDTYMFYGSYDDIARNTGVTYSVVVKTMQSAKSVGFIASQGNAKWHIKEKIFQHVENVENDAFVYIKNYAKYKGENLYGEQYKG